MAVFRHHPGPLNNPAADGDRLRVVIANEEAERFGELVVDLGHEAIAWERLPETGVEPDVVLVGRTEPDEAGFELIASIAHEYSSPILATISTHDRGYVQAATRAGAFGYVVASGAEELDCTLSVVVERYRKYRGLQDAFARRALVERAKGILMAVHGIDHDEAFDLLRAHARNNSRKLIDVAEAIVDSQPLLVPSWARPADGIFP